MRDVNRCSEGACANTNLHQQGLQIGVDEGNSFEQPKTEHFLQSLQKTLPSEATERMFHAGGKLNHMCRAAPPGQTYFYYHNALKDIGHERFIS